LLQAPKEKDEKEEGKERMKREERV